MARRTNGGALGALAQMTGSLPPVLALLLAIGSYFLFHWWAGIPARPAGSGMTVAGVPTSSVWHGFVLAAQYLVPGIFGVAALCSIAQRAPRGRRSQAPPPLPSIEDERVDGPRNEHDIYRIWAGDWDEAPGAPHGLDTSVWTLGLLRALEWKRFEELCAAYFRLLGFATRLAPPGPDGGVDIHLTAAGADQPGVLVQCKAWSSYDIGVRAIRELFGVMAAQKVAEGAFVTTGRFTESARDFALGKDILLIDGPDMLRKIQALPTEQQAELLALGTAGDFTRPTCPSCGVKMTRRIARSSGEAFWGCPHFPGCRTTLRIPDSGLV